MTEDKKTRYRVRIASALAFTVLSALGCRTADQSSYPSALVTSLSYSIPEEADYYIRWNVPDSLSTKELIRHSLDNLVLLGVFDESYLNSGSIDVVVFNDPRAEQLALQYLDTVYVNEGKLRKDVWNYMDVLLHEIAHRRWNQMSHEQQDIFRQTIKKYVAIAKEKVTADDSNYIWFFREFEGRKDYYQKKYGAEFEDRFYGSEAFAALIDIDVGGYFRIWQLENKFGVRPGWMKDTKLYNLDLPTDVTMHYRGFLSQEFFRNEE